MVIVIVIVIFSIDSYLWR